MSSIYDKASLVLIPSGTKTSKVYSQKPVSGDGDFTFSRSTMATRVNEGGAIEKETQNLLTNSNTFTSWIKSASGVTLTSGQSGYDGSSDAYQIEKDANAFRFVRQGLTSPTGVVTFSVYMKAGTLTTATMRLLSSPDARAKFNLSTGALISSSNVIDTSSEDAGGGWYRYSMTANMTTMAEQVIYPDDITTSNAGTIFVQDAQLEQGLVARDYIETTTSAVEGGITDNVPRLDYTDSSCPALLLEPQRTNLVPYSEYFETYTYYGSPTITHNDIASPEGLLNGTKVVRGTNAVPIRVQSITSLGTEYTMSIWAKAGTASQISIDIGNESAPTYDLTSEWQRFEVTSTPSSSTHIDITMPTASVGEYIYIYGLQLEAGSYATSYIPTYGTSVTRNRDTARLNNSSALPTSYPLTMYVESDVIGGVSGDLLSFLESSSSANYKVINYNGSQFGSNLRDDGIDNNITGSNTHSTGTYKLALVVTESSQKLYVNGVLEATGTSIPPFDTDINDILIGQLRVSADINRRNTTKQVLVFPTALTDQEAIDLTTL